MYFRRYDLGGKNSVDATASAHSEKKKPITNADRIRAMTDEELAVEIKEAIEWIKTHHDTQMKADDSEAMRMAISALKKQEGKTPINRRCPNCGSDDIEVWQDGGYRPTKFNFCPDCGQKIDWTEVDDGD